jgi:mono/diheme cytochrome c family protein
MLRLSVVGLAVLLGVGCDREVAGGRADGAAIYAEACASCHGDRGRPPESMRVQLGVRDLTAPELAGPGGRARIEERIRRGSDNKVMPPFAGRLGDAQIAAVTDYVLGLAAGSP